MVLLSASLLIGISSRQTFSDARHSAITCARLD
jgi:hypothetical protein